MYMYNEYTNYPQKFPICNPPLFHPSLLSPGKHWPPSVAYRFLFCQISHLFWGSFTLVSGDRGYSPCCQRSEDCSICFFLGVLSQEFPSNACFSQYFAEDSRGILFRSLHSPLFSGTPPPSPPQILTLSLKFSGVAWFCLASPSLCCGPKLSSGSKLGPSEAWLHLFCFSQGSCLVLLVVQCLKTILSCVLSGFSAVSFVRVI